MNIDNGMIWLGDVDIRVRYNTITEEQKQAILGGHAVGVLVEKGSFRGQLKNASSLLSALG